MRTLRTLGLLVLTTGLMTALAPATSASATATPLRHVVVIFQENVSFDRYFGIYPAAANTDGAHFAAAPGTPAIDGLKPTGPSVPAPLAHADDLTVHNPNGTDPRRLGATVNQLITCDQDHGYTDEQKAFDGGKMDAFPASVGTTKGFNFGNAAQRAPANQACSSGDDMNYYDGNTVTALWNYAQHFALSDNSFGSDFGPSSPGAINLVSGDTGRVGQRIRSGVSDDVTPDGKGGYALTGDAQPFYDDCSSRDAVSLTGENIGDELNAAGLSWGFFQGGFAPSARYSGQPAAAGSYDPETVGGRAVCGATHNVGVAVAEAVSGSPVVPAGRTDQGAPKGPYGTKADYVPHHEPFQYYASTANPHHLPPSSVAAIGTDTQTYTDNQPNFDTANHNYDMSDFDRLVAQITTGVLGPDHLPALSILKAPAYEDGHAGYSDPADEQQFVTKEINALERTPDWSSTAVIVAYDDSDGFYDHVSAFGQHGGQPQNPSHSDSDAMSGGGACGTARAAIEDQQGRCGFGPRLPLLVVSPYAKVNYVDHHLSDQASILNLVEYNWHLSPIPGSFDSILTNLDKQQGRPFDLAAMFDFARPQASAIQLDPRTGELVGGASPATTPGGGSDSDVLPAIVGGVVLVAVIAAGAMLAFGRRSVT